MSAQAMHDEDDEQFDLEITYDVPLLVQYVTNVLSDLKWDVDGALRYPLPTEMEEKDRELIEALREYTPGSYITLNGRKVYVDPEFPDSYEIYVKVGHASPRIPEGSK